LVACGRFRPIRRDSDSAESQSSASLAGSVHDVDVAPARLPPRSIGAPAVSATSAARYRRLKPTHSSNGSASSYDNLDEPSTPPQRQSRRQPWLPQSRSTRLVRPGVEKLTSPATDEALEEVGQRLTPGGSTSVDVSTGSTGVWRRPTLDGHIQVVPPTMIGVFDPTSLLSKFAAQTPAKRSPLKFQRLSRHVVRATETTQKEPISRLERNRVNEVNSIHNSRQFNAVTVHESPPPTAVQMTQPLESIKVTDSKSCSPCKEPSSLATSRSPELCQTACEEAQPPVEDGEGSSTSSTSSSSSSSSTDDDDGQDNAERTNVDNDKTEARSPEVDVEKQQVATPPGGDTGSSSDDAPAAAVDVGEQKSELAAQLSDKQSTTTSSTTTPSQDGGSGGHIDGSPFPLPVPATSPLVVEVDAENQAASPCTCRSSHSKSSCSSHDDNFIEQPELRISTTDLGTKTFSDMFYIGLYASQQFENS